MSWDQKKRLDLGILKIASSLDASPKTDAVLGLPAPTRTLPDREAEAQEKRASVLRVAGIIKEGKNSSVERVAHILKTAGYGRSAARGALGGAMAGASIGAPLGALYPFKSGETIAGDSPGLRLAKRVGSGMGAGAIIGGVFGALRGVHDEMDRRNQLEIASDMVDIENRRKRPLVAG